MYGARVRTPNSPRRLARLTASAVALPLLLAACASSSTSSGSTTTVADAGHQTAASVCTLITPAQIKATTGKSVGRPGVANSASATACTYPATDGRRSDSVIVTYRGHVTAAQAGAEQAALGKLHGTLTPVTVSSGQAFSYTAGSGSGKVTSLVTLIGETQVTVTATATLDQLESLSQLIFTTFATGSTSTTTAPAATATTAPA